jgi:predicted component of type VI protein secretion system
MPFGSLSIEARGGSMARELGISLAYLAAISGVEQSKLSLGFRQLGKGFNPQETERLTETLKRLTELQNSLAPLSLDLRNPANARLVIDALKGQDPEVIRQKIDKVFEDVKQ